RQFFTKVCCYVLGFPETFFAQRGLDWELIPSRDEPSTEGVKAAKETLKLADLADFGAEVPVPRPWAGAGFAWKLDGSSGERDIAAFVGDFGGKHLVNPGRERLLREFADAFIKAHRLATEREATRRTRDFRRAQNLILSGILRKLGVDIFDVE